MDNIYEFKSNKLKNFARQMFGTITNKNYFNLSTNIDIYDVANENKCTTDNKQTTYNKIVFDYIKQHSKNTSNNNIKIFVINRACSKFLNIHETINFPSISLIPEGIISNDNIYYVFTDNGLEYDDSFIVYIGYLFRCLLSKNNLSIYTKDNYSRDQHNNYSVYTRTLIYYGFTNIQSIIPFNQFALFPSYNTNSIPSYTYFDSEFKEYIHNINIKFKKDSVVKVTHSTKNNVLDVNEILDVNNLQQTLVDNLQKTQETPEAQAPVEAAGREREQELKSGLKKRIQEQNLFKTMNKK